MQPQESPQNRPQDMAGNVGRVLRMMRDAHHVSLHALAGLVGISPSHLSRIETGERAADAELLDAICDAIADLPVAVAA